MLKFTRRYSRHERQEAGRISLRVVLYLSLLCLAVAGAACTSASATAGRNVTLTTLSAAVNGCRTNTATYPPPSELIIRVVARKGVSSQAASRAIPLLGGGIWSCVTTATYVDGPRAEINLHLSKSVPRADVLAIVSFLRRTEKFSSVAVAQA